MRKVVASTTYKETDIDMESVIAEMEEDLKDTVEGWREDVEDFWRGMGG